MYSIYLHHCYHHIISVIVQILQHVNSQHSQTHSTIHADEQPHSHSTNEHSVVHHALQWANSMLPPTLGDFDWLLSQVSGMIILLCVCLPFSNHDNRSYPSQLKHQSLLQPLPSITVQSSA